MQHFLKVRFSFGCCTSKFVCISLFVLSLLQRFNYFLLLMALCSAIWTGATYGTAATLSVVICTRERLPTFCAWNIYSRNLSSLSRGLYGVPLFLLFV